MTGLFALVGVSRRFKSLRKAGEGWQGAEISLRVGQRGAIDGIYSRFEPTHYELA